MSHTPEHAILQCLQTMELNMYDGRGGHEHRRRPFRVLTDSVRFVKRRDWPGRTMFWVTCDAESDSGETEHWQWGFQATEEARGRWLANGISGGGGSGERSHSSGSPRVNLGGHWGREGFRACGTIEDAGAGVALVRLTDARGRIFDDTVDNDVVLLMSEEPVAMPMRLEMIDVVGSVVATDEWGFVDE